MAAKRARDIRGESDELRPVIRVRPWRQAKPGSGKGAFTKLSEIDSTRTYDYLFKLLLIGDPDVKRHKFLLRYIDYSYTTGVQIGSGLVDFKIKTIRLDGKTIKLQIWDTAGQERFRTITSTYYRGTSGIMLLYNISKPETFVGVKRWLQEVEMNVTPRVPRLLIGNNSHSEEDRRQVPREDAIELARQAGIPFLETNSKTNLNINEAFELLARLILRKRTPTQEVQPEGISALMVGESRPSNKSYGNLCKLMLLGDSGVDKADVLSKFTDELFIHTSDIDIMTKSIELNEKKIKLMIWNKDHDLTDKYYQVSMGIILVYDITSRESFENITKWLLNVKKYAPSDVVCLLIGNNSHSEEDRKVPREEGIELAQQLGIPFLETSTKTNHNINEAFEQLVRLIPMMSKEERHLMAFETALEKKGSLEQTIIHCLFFGHPRGGKSSLIKRLTGHPPMPNIPSTGVVVKVEIYTSTAMATHSTWNVLTFDDEALVLMATASQTLVNEKDSSRLAPQKLSTTDPDTPPPTNGEVLATTLPAKDIPYDEAKPTVDGSNEAISATGDEVTPIASTNVAEVDVSSDSSQDFISPLEILKRAIQRRGLEGMEQYLQSSLTLYLTDTGGQMEFQELLPALVAGPSVFFVVFRLDQDLNKTFTIEYLHPDGQSAEPYQSSFSVKETLLQSLASIASMGTYVYSKKLGKQIPLKPKVVLVGTHKDKVSPKRIAQIDRELQQLVKATSLYYDSLIEFASESQLVVTVDNLSPDDSDFHLVRSVLERIAVRGDFRVSSPSTWLIFSLIVRQQKKRVITYDECFGIAQKCGINSHDELNEALWFLNTKVGLVRHFRGEGLEELEEIVIIDPQILFDRITKLIVETFTFQKVTADIHEQFKRKGIFPLNVLEQLSGLDDEDQLLTVSRLVKLLEYLHIVARLHSDSKEVKFFMPCSLAHSESTAPVLAHPHSRLNHIKKVFRRSHEGKSKLAPPLLVTFDCGYCPKGLFSALSVYLLANKMQSRLVCKLQTNCIFKNSLSLSVGPYDIMTLTVTPTYLEISVIPADIEQKRKFPIEEICTEVQQCINKAVQEVTSSLNYTSDAKHTFAFYCPGNHKRFFQEKLHPAKIQFYNGDPCSIWCEISGKNLTYDLPKRHEYWFGEACSLSAAVPSNICCSLTSQRDSQQGVAASIEYHSLRQCYDQLIKGIQDPYSLADTLFARELISDTIRDEVHQIPGTRAENSRRLLSAIESKVSTEPGAFELFLIILKEEPTLCIFADRLRASCD